MEEDNDMLVIAESKIMRDEDLEKLVNDMISTMNTLDIAGGGVNGLALTTILRNNLRKDMIIVEVGSFKGGSSAFLAKMIINHGGKVFSVDHWKYEEILKIFRHNMSILGLEKVVVPIKNESEEAAKSFKDESIDFIFIDGDHTYENFKKDILSWYPKLKIGGIFCGHDCEDYYDDMTPEYKQMVENYKDYDSYINIHPGVIKCMHDLFGRNFRIANTIWYLQKKNKTL